MSDILPSTYPSSEEGLRRVSEAFNRQSRRLSSGLFTQYTSASIAKIPGTYALDATSGAVVFQLDSAANYRGQRFTVKKTDVSANAVTVTPYSAQTIDGAATYALSARWKYVTVESDGVNWLVVANN